MVANTGLRLWLVRHGATETTDAGRLTGWSDPPLNARGHEQAMRLKGILGGKRFDGVWSSDLRRSAETAEIICGRCVEDPRLRELNFGRLEGLVWEEVEPQHQEALLAFDGFRAPGGESVEELCDRVHSFIDELPDGDHLIVTHGGVVRLLLREIGADRFVPAGGWMAIDWTNRAIVSAAAIRRWPNPTGTGFTA